MSDAFFFGYGSLVNRRTHDYAEVYPARLAGWRRVWRHTHLRPLAFLSVEPAPQAEIEGLIAAVPRAEWAPLDTREAAYERRALAGGLAHTATRAVSAAVYVLPERSLADPGVRHPILLSYLDVVVQGYLQQFGEPGGARFFATTEGWDAPVIDDRRAPRYARTQAIGARERDVVDAALAALGVRVIGR